MSAPPWRRRSLSPAATSRPRSCVRHFDAISGAFVDTEQSPRVGAGERVERKLCGVNKVLRRLVGGDDHSSRYNERCDHDETGDDSDALHHRFLLLLSAEMWRHGTLPLVRERCKLRLQTPSILSNHAVAA